MAPTSADGQRPSKRVRLLSDNEESSDESSSSVSGIIEPDVGDNDRGSTLRINSEYAKRFEHNKKREELQRLEEKYGKTSGQENDEDEDDSEDESEDDDAELATHELDDEIAATLQAIRSKDKRLYDKDNVFYKSLDRQDNATKAPKSAKPVTLRDYHRQNILATAAEDGQDEAGSAAVPAMSEQQSLRKSLLTAADDDGNAVEDEAEDEDEFFKKRPGQELPAQQRPPAASADLENAEQDPETFLTKFMSSRAWVPDATSKWKAFESDDEEEDEQAAKFEDAYNMRFEDPNLANQTLLSHSRTAVADYSVRREKANPRKRAREVERAKKDEERSQRDHEKTRLRNLKLEKAADKLKQFKDAAGVRAKGLDVDEWNAFLEAGWDSDKWDKEMQQRFGDQYYAEKDRGVDTDGETTGRKRDKKPTWNDDIDIGDIVPDFKPEDDEADFSLSEDETAAAGSSQSTSKKGKGDDAKTRTEKQRAKRKERRQLEELVDQQLAQDILPATKKETGPFRYRETSPTSFGLSSRDILMADDAALNQFAGLKKLASFRDAERKRRDAKKLSKSAHLRQWRKETFGNEQGPNGTFQDHVESKMPDAATGAKDVEVDGEPEGPDEAQDKKRKKKKQRSRKRKVSIEA